MMKTLIPALLALVVLAGCAHRSSTDPSASPRPDKKVACENACGGSATGAASLTAPWRVMRSTLPLRVSIIHRRPSGPAVTDVGAYCPCHGRANLE